MGTLPIIAYWTSEPYAHQTRRKLYTNINECTDNLVGIKSMRGGVCEGSLMIFNPNVAVMTEMQKGCAIHFLEDGRMIYGQAHSNPDGTYNITSYKPYTAAKNVRIKSTHIPDKMIF